MKENTQNIILPHTNCATSSTTTVSGILDSSARVTLIYSHQTCGECKCLL